MLLATFQILSHSNINSYMIAVNNTDFTNEPPENFRFSFIKFDIKEGLLIELRSEIHSKLNAEEWFLKSIQEDIISTIRKNEEITIIGPHRKHPIRIFSSGNKI